MRYYMLNKPPCCLSAVRDGRDRTVLDLFPEEEREGLHPVGRLDRDTRGLLLITDDGMVDQALLLPERHAVKKYVFYAIGEMTDGKAKKLEEGVVISENGVVSRPAVFTLLERMTVKDIEDYIPEARRSRYLKNPDGPAFRGQLEICEGRKHQVKLMMRAVGTRVTYLKRTEIGGIKLDERLAEGEYRRLNAEEMKLLIGLENEIRRKKLPLPAECQ